MNDAPDYFSVGAIMPGASSSPFMPASPARAGSSPAANGALVNARAGCGGGGGGSGGCADNGFADGTQSFQDLDISPPARDRTPSGAGTAEADGPFHVTVTEPARQGEGMHAYIAYKVTTRTSLPQYSAAEFHVSRRFRDFDWLFTQLVGKWPGLIIPPLPEKPIVGKVSGADFTPEFVEGRRKHLETFVRRVTSHVELHHAEALQVFLEASDEAFDAAKAASRAHAGQPGRWGQLLTDGWHGLRSWSGKSLGMSTAALPDGGVGDRQCDELRAYVSRLESQLGALHRSAERLAKRHRSEAAGMTEVGAAFAQLGANGDEDWPKPLASQLSHLGVTSDLAARALSEQADAECESLEEPLRDVLRRLHQCRQALSTREHAYHAWQSAIATLDARRSKAAKAIGAEATDGKAQQMELELGEGEAAVRQAHAEYDQIKERTNREVARFQEEVMHDVKALLATFVRLQANSCNREHGVWSQLLPRFEATVSKQR
ncbi:hypothetical protein KFE25_006105 [Diacronema lutheri]|uniref:PX domain-containing protein n=2 Tax=Diacronema lutheri TaxID=2081491 RepID=A0A8J5XXB3_DIALT|nr:hypothetical protein KFE25_006105 [Diacronema lutheri]